MASAQQVTMCGVSVPPVPVGSFTFGFDTAALSLAWPSGHQTDDIGVLLVETANEALTTPTGWTAINTPTGAGTAGTGTRLYAFWKRATSGAEAAASIPDSGVGQNAVMFVLRGCDTGVTPFEAVVDNTDGTNNTAATVPATTTLGHSRYVVGACSNHGNPGGTNQTSCSWTTNTALLNFVELADNAQNFQGAIGAFGGQMSAAGSTGTTAGTFVGNGPQERVIFAAKPIGG